MRCLGGKMSGSASHFEDVTPGDVAALIDAHSQGAGSTVVIKGTTWNYRSSSPGPLSGFVVLAPDGSGMLPAQGPSIFSFSATPPAIDDGGSTTLNWRVEPTFETLTISPTPGDVSGNTGPTGIGSIEVTPSENTTYTLTATPTGNQTADTWCGSFTLTHLGEKDISGGSLSADRCW